MSNLLRQAIQAALGSNFALGRELGGGGMSRVFVGRDETLERDVVVKVLAPEMVEGLSVVRFTREIRLAAGLHEFIRIRSFAGWMGVVWAPEKTCHCWRY